MPSARSSPPRVLILGAGSRGHAYASVLCASGDAIVQSVAEPIAFKRSFFVKQYIHPPSSSPSSSPAEDASFSSWQQFLRYEAVRRERAAAGENVLPGIDAVFVCTMDHTHREIVEAFAPLGVHVMCEKPLATSLEDCLGIYRAMGGGGTPRQVFSIGHVLRYSPHNMMLRRMVREERVIGDVLSVEHTEPVGWWHFSHSYVRGNWRKESTSAPSLLTKSCHDIDFLLWLISAPASTSPNATSHHPKHVFSSGSLSYFKRNRKPVLAGGATNCLSCPAEPSCSYSAKKIYMTHMLDRGVTGWPVKIVVPEIEDIASSSREGAREKLLAALGEDYGPETPREEVEARGWYGRCVYESDNDVLDDQTVTLAWDEESLEKPAKTASFHMVAFTHAQCDRRGRIYGTEGEISYDSNEIQVYKFATRETQSFFPKQEGGGHGGGDAGLARQFVRAVRAVQEGDMGVEEAQREFVGCTVEDAVRSHALVWAAEEARREGKVVDWGNWWKANFEEKVDVA